MPDHSDHCDGRELTALRDSGWVEDLEWQGRLSADETNYGADWRSMHAPSPANPARTARCQPPLLSSPPVASELNIHSRLCLVLVFVHRFPQSTCYLMPRQLEVHVPYHGTVPAGARTAVMENVMFKCDGMIPCIIVPDLYLTLCCHNLSTYQDSESHFK